MEQGALPWRATNSIASWCNSSMPGFDPDGLGANPSEAANYSPLAQNQSGSLTNCGRWRVTSTGYQSCPAVIAIREAINFVLGIHLARLGMPNSITSGLHPEIEGAEPSRATTFECLVA